MKKNLKYLSLIPIILLLFGVQYLAYKSKQPIVVEKKPQEESTTSIQQSLNGVNMVENEGSKKTWQMMAKTGHLDSNGNWKIEKINMRFFGENNVTYDVESDSGEMISDNQNSYAKVNLHGKVKTTSSNGYVFNSKNAVYEKASKKIVFPQKIKVEGPKGSNILLTGEHLEINLNSNTINVKKKVYAQQRMDSSGVIASLTCDSANISGKNHIANFSGNIKLKMQGYTLYSQKASFNFTNKNLVSAILTDQIKVISEKQLITAKSLNINFANKDLFFKGNAKIEEGDSTITGDQINVLDNGRKVQATKVKANVDANSVK